jgi:glycosyltransferase involved in cell wall biosynthesis
MSIVLEEVPDAVLVVAGGGAELKNLSILAKPLGTAVRFLGWRADVNLLYASADVVVISSDNEGMPVTLIEAALVGLPVVATDVGSVSEVVVDEVTGFLVEQSAEAVASGLIRLLKDDALRARMGSEASRWAGQRFGVDRLIRDHEELYERSLRA